MITKKNIKAYLNYILDTLELYEVTDKPINTSNKFFNFFV